MHARVEFVIRESEGDQGIHTEQVGHGKLSNISSTSRILRAR